jgi:Tol biopolymer transport system component
MRLSVIVALALIGVPFLVGCACECEDEAVATQPTASGPWLGQEPPGTEPSPFIATALAERDTAWTPDGRQLFYSVNERNRGVILTRHEGADGWSSPEFAAFSGEHPDLEPFVTADGAWLVFISKRPLPGEAEPGDWNIWRLPRVGDGWGAAEPLLEPVNSGHQEFYPSLTISGDLYFTSDRPGGLGGEDIWRAEWTGDGWAEPEDLGPAVNSPGPEFNSLIAPDGSWLIFGSVREGDVGGGDMHIAFRGPDGEFLPSVNMGAPINSTALDYCPALSPDGSIFFFTSSRVPAGGPEPASFADLENLMAGPANGRDNIWWMSAEAIEVLRKQVVESP